MPKLLPLFAFIVFWQEIGLAQQAPSPPSQPIPTTPSVGAPASPPGSSPPTTTPSSVQAPPAVNLPAPDPLTVSPPPLPSTSSTSAALGLAYDPTGLRDPFQIHRSLIKDINFKNPAVSEKPKIDVTDPLLKLDLERVEVLGIMWEVSQPRAIITEKGDPTGRVFTIYKNTKVGRNNGIVTMIRECEIVINESYEEAGITNVVPKVFSICKN